jgi:phage baseplate assembly protein W
MAGVERDPVAVADLMLAGPARAPNLDGGGDWRTLAGVDNLLQAIWVRLNTPEGALSGLGHPAYGSRLHRLIGALDTPATRERARLHVARALAREPRIAEILAVDVDSVPQGGARRLLVRAAVRPVGTPQPLVFRFPIFLEGDA